MGLRSRRMETIQDYSEKSARGHGKDAGLGWVSDQEPGWGYVVGGFWVLHVAFNPLWTKTCVNLLLIKIEFFWAKF